MDRLIKHLQSMKRRMGISVGLFVVFSVIALTLAVRGDVSDSEYFLPVVIPLAAAIFVLPRQFLLSRWPSGETAEEQDQIDLYRDELRMLQGRATMMRIAYLALTAFYFFALPALGI